MNHAVVLNDFGELQAADRGVLEALAENNAYCPAVTKTVFNLKTECKKPVLDENGEPVREQALDDKGNPRVDAGGNKIMCNKKKSVKLDNPILSTTCFFADGTSVTVKNSPHDKIETETVWLDENGDVTTDESKKKIETTVACDCAKERGVCYAIIKRICGLFDSDGRQIESSANRLLIRLVKTGEDRAMIEAKAKVVKAVKKAKYEARKAKEAEKKPAPKRYSKAQITDLLGAFLEKAVSDEDLLERLKTSLSSRD